MAIVVPLNLSQNATSILRVLSLYNCVPALQSYDVGASPVLALPSQFTRDTSLVSFGFPHSFDNAYSPTDGAGVFSLPQNAYAIGNPANVYSNTALISATYSVLLLDTDCAPIEPGYSRLRIDYVNPQNSRVVDYVDMPFYPKWDTHPRELQEIVEYATESMNYGVQNANNLSLGIYLNAERAQLKGLSVSGQVFATQATQGLQAQQIHFAAPFFKSASKQKKNVKNYFLQNHQFVRTRLQDGKTNAIETISPGHIFAGVAVTICTNFVPHVNDEVFLSGYKVAHKREGKSFIIQIPSQFAFSYTLLVDIRRNGKSLINNPTYIFVEGLPEIKNVVSPFGKTFFKPGEKVTLYGFNFQETQGEIFLGDMPLEINAWSDDKIEFTLPNEILADSFLRLVTWNGISANSIIPLRFASDFAINASRSFFETELYEPQQVQLKAYLNGVEVSPEWSIIHDKTNHGNGNQKVGFIDTSGLYVVSPGPEFVNKTVTLVAHYFDGYKTNIAKFNIRASCTYTMSMPKNIDALSVNASAGGLSRLSYHINAQDTFLLTVINDISNVYFSATNTTITGFGNAGGSSSLFVSTNANAAYISYTPPSFGNFTATGTIGYANADGTPLGYLPFNISFAVFAALPQTGTTTNTLTIGSPTYSFCQSSGVSAQLFANYSE